MAQSTQGSAESVTSDAKAAVSEASTAAQTGMREQYESTREVLTQSGQRMSEQAKDTLRSMAEEQKMRAVQGLHGVAKSMHQMARSLHDEQQETPARYVDMAADQIERGVRLLEERGVPELMSGVETFARRQPAVFIGGAFAAGFLLARFLKTSDRSAQRQTGYARSGFDRTESEATAMAGGRRYGEDSSFAGSAMEQPPGGGI